jgi:hypothetical protein
MSFQTHVVGRDDLGLGSRPDDRAYVTLFFFVADPVAGRLSTGWHWLALVGTGWHWLALVGNTKPACDSHATPGSGLGCPLHVARGRVAISLGVQRTKRQPRTRVNVRATEI